MVPKADGIAGQRLMDSNNYFVLPFSILAVKEIRAIAVTWIASNIMLFGTITDSVFLVIFQ